VVRTVVIWETGELVLPRETLEESHTIAGTELVVMARAGQILLLDRVQVRRRLEDIGQKMRGPRSPYRPLVATQHGAGVLERPFPPVLRYFGLA
jgi:hypothetical protein